MIPIPGYIITAELNNGGNTILYRGIRHRDQCQVILKVLKGDCSTPTEMAKLHYEYDITKQLNLPGIVTAYELKKINSSEVLILEDFGGEPLDKLIASHTIDIQTFLELAIQITEIVGQVHSKNIFHKRINPRNIFVNPITQQVKLTNFSFASRLAQEKPILDHQDLTELLYIAPEEIGRCDRTIDYRTDFYALGMTFYKILTGIVPFCAKDRSQLIHDSIAKEPLFPHQVNPDIPETLSHIIGKLLAKEATHRYQRAIALKADLETCLKQWQESGEIEAFPLARQDTPEIIRLFPTIHLRNAELSALVKTYERVSQEGQAEIFLISGKLGMGKSELVKEIYPTVIKNNGFFVSGKFNSLSQTIPYSALVQALRQLITQLLVHESESLSTWKVKLVEALGNNGQVILEIIPELGLIVGKQSPLPQLTAQESQNRLNQTFLQLISLFTQKEHPLVIFLDDLHEADLASLHLIEQFMTQFESQYLLIIGTYQDSPQSSSACFKLMIERLKRNDVKVNQIALEPLSLSDINQSMTASFKKSLEEVNFLGTFLLDKTQGNPFLIYQVLDSLYSRKILTFDAIKGSWTWDLDRLAETSFLENVLELISQKIKSLSPKTRKILQIAACIGYEFDLKTLSLANGKSPAETATELGESLEKGFVIPIGENYRLLHNGKKAATMLRNSEEVTIVYQFSHESIQESAYSLSSQENRQENHLRVGQLFFRQNSLEVLEDNLFSLVNSLNLGKALITEVERNYQLAELNLKAGEKAKRCAAYSEASHYFAAGLSLLGKESWETHYELTFSLHLNRLECEYCNGNFEEADTLFNITLENAKTKVEQINLYALKIELYANLNRQEEAIELGIQALKQFGIYWKEAGDENTIPSAISQVEAFRNDQQVILFNQEKGVLGDRQIAELIALPKIQDEVQLAKIALLKSLASPTYSTKRSLWLFVISKIVEISLEFGNTDISAFAYMAYGVFLSLQLGNPQAGYQFGKLAFEVNEKFPNVRFNAEIYFLFGAFINSGTHSMKGDFYYLEKSFNYSKENGNLKVSACVANVLVAETYLKGELLEKVDQTVGHYKHWVQKMKDKQSVYFQTMVQRVSLCLQGLTENSLILSDEEFNEEDFIAKMEAWELENPLQFYYLIKMQLFYLEEDFVKALEMAGESEKRLSDCVGLLSVIEHYFYYSLTLSSLYNQVSLEEKSQYWNILEESQEKLKTASENCSVNFEHKYLLVAAEVARISNAIVEAMELYDAAIASAKENEYLQNEALANELAGKFYLAQGKEKFAKLYLIEARQAYLEWGAKTQVKRLETTYPALLSEMNQTGAAIAEQSIILPSDENASLDLTAVMKAAQTLSGEIVLDQLLKKMMKIMLKNAGAQFGVLMLNHDGKLFIESKGRIDQEEVEVFQSIPVEGCESIPVTLINYVRRTKEYVVLNNAGIEGFFTNDPYILQNQPKSILCTPILNQGKLIGILYLENNLSTGAFTKDRLIILQMLSSQSAISIENARLYSNLEEALKTQVQLTQAYGRFVPHEILQFLKKKSIVDVELGDQVQTEMTILFVDIRSFTTLSETMSPKENFNFLNSYLSRVSPIIRNHNGFIDKYIGDAIMALFPNKADDAIKAAIAIQNEVVRYNIHRQRSGYPPISVGIGIHTGSLMLGTIGESQRLEGTVISDAVNLASRLEGLTKEYGSLIIISGQTLIHLQDAVPFNYRFIDKVKVKGKNKYVAVFEIFDSDPLPIMQLKHQTRQQFEQAVLRYHNKDMAEANELFQSILQLNPEDKAAQLYFKRCGYLN